MAAQSLRKVVKLSMKCIELVRKCSTCIYILMLTNHYIHAVTSGRWVSVEILVPLILNTSLFFSATE